MHTYSHHRTGRPIGRPVLSEPVRRRREPEIVYLRRRAVAAFAFTVAMAVLWFGAGTVLASRGGDPASVPTVRPGTTHVARPGDTMWSIALAHRGETPHVEYVAELVALNGSASVEVGQEVVLP